MTPQTKHNETYKWSPQIRPGLWRPPLGRLKAYTAYATSQDSLTTLTVWMGPASPAFRNTDEDTATW